MILYYHQSWKLLRFTGLEISCTQHPDAEQKKKKKIKRISKTKTEDLH